MLQNKLLHNYVTLYIISEVLKVQVFALKDTFTTSMYHIIYMALSVVLMLPAP